MTTEYTSPAFDICAAANCSGCGACASICPANAITMIPDAMGFLHPEIDFSRCTNCGLCRKTCPVANLRTGTDISAVYAAQAKDTALLKKSASGGIFGLLARKILAQKGKVYGAAYTDHFRKVQHRSIESLDDLDLLLCSKYLQSDTADTYSEVKADLKDGRKVLYSGTPCQIAGLKAFLGKDNNNLLCVDILCHGVPSPAVWRTWLESVCPDVENITSLSFRDKKISWMDFALSFFKKDETTFWEHRYHNLFFYFFLQNYSLRESCSHCPFHRNESQSDITIGDYWGLNSPLAKQFKQVDLGVSVILVRTDKGTEYLGQLHEDLTLVKSTLNHAAAGNQVVNHPVDLPLQWDEFRNDFTTMSAEDFLKKWQPPQTISLKSETLYEKFIRKTDDIKLFLKEKFFSYDTLILTHPLLCNYGGIMQAFAMQTVLRQFGYKPITVNWLSQTKTFKKRLTLSKKIKSIITGGWKKFICCDRDVWLRPWIGNPDSPLYDDKLYDQKFQSLAAELRRDCIHTIPFIRKHIKQTRLISYEDFSKKAAAYTGFRHYVVGSDQIWRSTSFPDVKTCFLNFLPPDNTAKKVAYAASFGLNWLVGYTDADIQQTKELLQRFDAVSLREESGVTICQEELKKQDAIWKPDPTLLLTADDYRKLFSCKEKTERSLFCYILDDTRNKLLMRQKIADKLGLRINLFRLPDDQEHFTARPVEEWLAGIESASFVIADSFHGIVFSIIFRKNFIAVGNEKRGLTRFLSLLKMFRLEHRLVRSLSDVTDELINTPIDYCEIDQIHTALRNDARKWLKDALTQKGCENV